MTADGTLATTAKQSLTLGSATTGNITLSGFGTGIVKTNAAGVLSSSAVNLASADVTGVLTTDNGGTGLNTYSAGDLLYYTSGTTLTRLAIGADGTCLSVSGSAPSWSP
jgi:hypothetical protein